MADIAWQSSEGGDGLLRITPLVEGEQFPKFEEMEVYGKKQDRLRGWAGKDEPRNMRLQDFGHIGPVQVVSYNENEVVLKRIR